MPDFCPQILLIFLASGSRQPKFKTVFVRQRQKGSMKTSLFWLRRTSEILAGIWINSKLNFIIKQYLPKTEDWRLWRHILHKWSTCHQPFSHEFRLIQSSTIRHQTIYPPFRTRDASKENKDQNRIFFSPLSWRLRKSFLPEDGGASVSSII